MLYQKPIIEVIIVNNDDIVRTSLDGFVQDGPWGFGEETPADFE